MELTHRSSHRRVSLTGSRRQRGHCGLVLTSQRSFRRARSPRSYSEKSSHRSLSPSLRKTPVSPRPPRNGFTTKPLELDSGSLTAVWSGTDGKKGSSRAFLDPRSTKRSGSRTSSRRSRAPRCRARRRTLVRCASRAMRAALRRSRRRAPFGSRRSRAGDRQASCR